MNVSNTNKHVEHLLRINDVQNIAAKNGPDNPAAAQRAETPQDKVSLSDASKDILFAREVVDAMPEVRLERISRLKQQIMDGSYRIDAEKIAERIITDAA